MIGLRSIDRAGQIRQSVRVKSIPNLFEQLPRIWNVLQHLAADHSIDRRLIPTLHYVAETRLAAVQASRSRHQRLAETQAVTADVCKHRLGAGPLLQG